MKMTRKILDFILPKMIDLRILVPNLNRIKHLSYNGRIIFPIQILLHYSRNRKLFETDDEDILIGSLFKN